MDGHTESRWAWALRAWGQTVSALRDTYYRAGVADATGLNLGQDGPYLLAGLSHMRQLWERDNAHRHTPQAVLDSVAASEVRYLYRRGKSFRRPAAALWTCWGNLVLERPERVLELAASMAGRGEVAVTMPLHESQHPVRMFAESPGPVAAIAGR